MPSRGYLQGLRPFHGPNLLLFLLSLPVLYFVRTLYRNCSIAYALPLFGLILFMSIKAQRAVQELHLEKDDKSEIIYKTYSKRQIKVRSWLVFISIEIGLFALLLFHKLFVQQMSLSTFLEKIIQTEIMIPLLVFGLSIGAIFGTMVYSFLSLHKEK